MFLSRDNFIEAIGRSYDILFSKPIDKSDFISKMGGQNVSVQKAESLWYNLFEINKCNRLPWSIVLYDNGLAIGNFGLLASFVQPLIHPLSLTEIEECLIGYNSL